MILRKKYSADWAGCDRVFNVFLKKHPKFTIFCLIPDYFLLPLGTPFWSTFGGPAGVVVGAKPPGKQSALGTWRLPKGAPKVIQRGIPKGSQRGSRKGSQKGSQRPPQSVPKGRQKAPPKCPKRAPESAPKCSFGAFWGVFLGNPLGAQGCQALRFPKEINVSVSAGGRKTASKRATCSALPAWPAFPRQ